MKKSFIFLVVLAAHFFSLPLFSQTDNEPVALGLPGDNLNLYAVLDVFQKSKTLEEFERVLNEQDSKVNNLDLNNDGEIDYIEIESQKKGNRHVIVLQVAINSKEKQDVAVIEVDKDKKNNVHVQIIGDQDLYGKNYIIEPSDTVGGTPNPGYNGGGTVIVNNNTTNNYNTTAANPNYVTANVSVWPVVLYLFSPVYVVYRSPWYWGYYPSYWRPWRPVYYHDYWGYHGHYYREPYYRRTERLRNQRYYNTYASRRNSSAVVRNYRTSGRYNATYNGREYRRPAPVTNTRPTRPSTTRPGTRPTNPSTRPGTTRPGTRPVDPSTRPGTTRPETSRPGTRRPTTRPVTPTNPSTRPAVRPAQPSNRPTNPTTRPVTRPTQPTTRPASRPAGTRNATPPSTNRGSSPNRRQG